MPLDPVVDDEHEFGLGVRGREPLPNGRSPGSKSVELTSSPVRIDHTAAEPAAETSTLPPSGLRTSCLMDPFVEVASTCETVRQTPVLAFRVARPAPYCQHPLTLGCLSRCRRWP